MSDNYWIVLKKSALLEILEGVGGSADWDSVIDLIAQKSLLLQGKIPSAWIESFLEPDWDDDPLDELDS